MSLHPWKPSRAEWNESAASHLYRRAAFGASTDQLEDALQRGLRASVESILADDRPLQPMHEGITALLAQNDIADLQSWWLALILSGKGAWRERLTLVWHNHFATSFDKVQDVRLMNRQNELFRSTGSGDFRELLHAVAKDTAMLLWLDGNENKEGQPNENFARELMELFGLGIGNYTEDDIQGAARALTGWGTKGRSSVFRERYHDTGEKRFLGRQGRLGAEDVIDAVLEQPACSYHIAHRILVEYVGPAPEKRHIGEVAAELVANEWNIGQTLRTLFLSELFFAEASRRSRIASPVELVAGSIRALKASIAPKRASELCAQMGQALFRPPNVKGWDGHEAWINVGTWIARHNAMVEVAQATGGENPSGNSMDDLRATLLPGIDARHLETALEHATRKSKGAEQATRLSAALVLTAPEYHLA